MNKHLIPFLLLLTFISCREIKIEYCDCESAKIFAVSRDIIFPIRNTEKDVRGGYHLAITSKEVLNEISKKLNKLTISAYQEPSIDVRIVIDLFCQNGSTKTILMNNHYILMEEKIYHQDESILCRIEDQLATKKVISGKVLSVKSKTIKDVKNIFLQEFLLQTSEKDTIPFSHHEFEYLVEPENIINKGDSLDIVYRNSYCEKRKVLDGYEVVSANQK